MAPRIRITDVSPRDGLQNEQGVVPAADKATLIALLASAGVDEVEEASFVAPRWVPQLADAEEVLAMVAGASEPRAPRAPSSSDPDPQDRARGARGSPVLSALVPNTSGFARLEAVNTRAGRRLISKVSVFTAASETFSLKNTNATIAQTIERFREFVPRAAGEGYAVRMYVSCAVECPFEGPIAPEAVRRVADALLTLCPTGEIDLGDTIGVATPEQVRALLGVFTAPEREALTLHLHDTFGRAAACVREALALGVRSFDGSVAGLGGCPYAGTKEKRAPGNIATETVVRIAREAGFETGVNADALDRAAAFAREIVAKARLAAAQEGAR